MNRFALGGTRRYAARGGAAVWIWLLMVGGYALILLGRRQGWVHGLWDWYAADALCLPLVLGVSLIAQRWRECDPALCLPRWHGLLAALVYAGYFELVLPRLMGGSVADPIDSVCYLVGWIFFEILLNQPPKKRAVTIWPQLSRRGI